MKKPETRNLSRRERQIMDILFSRGRASASEIQQAMADAPGYSAVRATLRILEEKGQVRHQEENLKYMYMPTVAREKATRSAVEHLLETFFDGSPEKAVVALLDGSASKLSSEELDRIADLIEKARKEGR
jgi:BlaI family transcriptional regulator, penicillinase repressor